MYIHTLLVQMTGGQDQLSNGVTIRVLFLFTTVKVL